MVGSPPYMSPQIIRLENYTAKCEIWSLGLIYYEILVGKTPWEAFSRYKLIENIQNNPIDFSAKYEIS